MRLYNNALEVEIPEGYNDISRRVNAQDYQYIFSKTSKRDDLLIVDLMRPEENIALQIEEILELNDNIESPVAVRSVVTGAKDLANLKDLCSRYSGPEPEMEEERDPGVAWILFRGLVSPGDQDPRELDFLVGVIRDAAADVVVSVFKEGGISREEMDMFAEMFRNARIAERSVVMREEKS
jgi:hypothetical protein